MLNDKDMVALMAAYLLPHQVAPNVSAAIDMSVEQAYEIHTKAAARVVQGEKPDAAT